MCFNNIWLLVDIPLYGICVLIAMETFSNRKKRCLIDRFMNRIGILRGVCVFNNMSVFKQSSEQFHFSFPPPPPTHTLKIHSFIYLSILGQFTSLLRSFSTYETSQSVGVVKTGEPREKKNKKTWQIFKQNLSHMSPQQTQR